MTTTISIEFSSSRAWLEAARDRGLKIIAHPTGDHGRPVSYAFLMQDGKPVVYGKLRTIGVDGKSGVQGWLQEVRP